LAIRSGHLVRIRTRREPAEGALGRVRQHRRFCLRARCASARRAMVEAVRRGRSPRLAPWGGGLRRVACSRSPPEPIERASALALAVQSLAVQAPTSPASSGRPRSTYPQRSIKAHVLASSGSPAPADGDRGHRRAAAACGRSAASSTSALTSSGHPSARKAARPRWKTARKEATQLLFEQATGGFAAHRAACVKPVSSIYTEHTTRISVVLSCETFAERLTSSCWMRPRALTRGSAPAPIGPSGSDSTFVGSN
jgi:hypothetical protein